MKADDIVLMLIYIQVIKMSITRKKELSTVQLSQKLRYIPIEEINGCSCSSDTHLCNNQQFVWRVVYESSSPEEGLFADSLAGSG